MSAEKDKNNPNTSATEACWRLVSRSPEKYGDSAQDLGSNPAQGFQEAQVSALIRTIESEIIPRLVANHGGGLSASGPLTAAPIAHSEVLSFTRIALSADSAGCMTVINSLLERGISLPSIYLDLLGPAARELDGMWARDECDFTEITVALWRIQQVMYDLSPEFRNGGVQRSGKNNRIMLTAIPGSQHTLGILMVAEFFRRAGWQVWGEPLADRHDLLAAVSRQHFDVLGISIGSEPQLEAAKGLIAELRKASQNPSLIIMAGGPVFVHHPEYSGAIGADVYAMNAQEAVSTAAKAVGEHGPEHASFFGRG